VKGIIFKKLSFTKSHGFLFGSLPNILLTGRVVMLSLRLQWLGLHHILESFALRAVGAELALVNIMETTTFASLSIIIDRLLAI
jgi:hypothetical protein